MLDGVARHGAGISKNRVGIWGEDDFCSGDCIII